MTSDTKNPGGWPGAPGVRLDECPPGLFVFDGTLCFRSEYSSPAGLGFKRDAYVVETGEYFWGGAKTSEERASLVVVPVDPITPAEVAAREAAARAEGMREAARIVNNHAAVLRAIKHLRDADVCADVAAAILAAIEKKEPTT